MLSSFVVVKCIKKSIRHQIRVVVLNAKKFATNSNKIKKKTIILFSTSRMNNFQIMNQKTYQIYTTINKTVVQLSRTSTRNYLFTLLFT